MEDTQFNRLMTYNDNVCWQYHIRKESEENDLDYLRQCYNITPNDIKIKDFQIKLIDNKLDKQNAINFIKKYEWLGNITQYSTHYFGAYYKDLLGGVIIFSMKSSPKIFSQLRFFNAKRI